MLYTPQHPYPPIEELQSYVDALIEGDRDHCRQIVHQLLADGTPILHLYQGLLQPALYRVGDLWAGNRISVAVEHMSTAITEELLNQVYPQLINPKRCGRKVVVATVENELHQVGVKMVCDIFEMHGWDSVFNGAGLATGQIFNLLEQEKPDLLGISFSVFFHLETLANMLSQLQKVYPQLPILVGGQGLQQDDGTLEKAFPTVTFIHSLDQLSAGIAQDRLL